MGAMGELAAEQKQLRAELRRLNGEQQTALEHLRNEQEKGRQQAEELLAQKFQNLASPEPVSVQAWKTAEVEYLLRVANQRVLMERDVKGALGLLKSADGLLSELDDYAMHDVRAALAEEILRLEQFVSADVSGIFLRLEAVKTPTWPPGWRVRPVRARIRPRRTRFRSRHRGRARRSFRFFQCAGHGTGANWYEFAASTPASSRPWPPPRRPTWNSICA